MRIVCQKCSAAYAIDDKFVTPKGVRAQCPRCRHLQLVKKDDAPPADASIGQTQPGNAAPFLFDMSAPPPPPGASAAAPAPEAPASGGLHFGQTTPSAAPPAAAAPSPFDFMSPGKSPAAPAPFDFSAPATSPSMPALPVPAFPGREPPPAPPPPPASPFDFSGNGSPFDFGSPPPNAPGQPSQSPFGDANFDLSAPMPPPDASPSATPGAPSQMTGVKCRTCGKDMSDPFDQALGVCDDCRNKEADPPNAAPAAPAASAAPTSPAAAQLFAAPSFPSPNTPIGGTGGVQSAGRSEAPQGRGRMIGVVVAAAVVIAVVVGVVVKRPWATRPPPLVVKGTGEVARPVEAIVQQWRTKYLELEKGSGPRLIDEGEEQLAKDTTNGYLDAEESFEQALVLEPSNDRALAGWVLALAFGRPGKVDEPTAKAAESMLAAAEQRGSDLRVFVAHAHFLISRSGNPNDIKVLAERGLSAKSANDRALALLAIGQTILTKNPQQAAETFNEALTTDPKLKRAYFFQAQLAAIQGNYKEATRALERRLELDPDQWEAAEELARLLADVGEVPKARKVLEAARTASRGARPRIGLAMLAYQHQNDLAGATTELVAVIDDREVARGERADALVHLATIQRIQGELDKANDTINKSLELSADSVPAKLQRLLISVERNQTADARMEVDALKGKLGDKRLEATLEGRVLVLEGRMDDAIQILGATSEADPRRVDATLLAGAAAAKARKSGKAWEFCLKRGLRADPLSRPVPSLTHLYVRPADLLKVAVGTFMALVPDADEDPSPSVCEGLIAWFSDDLAAADKHFSKVISIDPRHAEGFAYRSLIAMKKRDLASAQRLAGKAVDGNKSSGLAWLAQGMALSAANKTEPAKVSAREAQKFGPQFLAPRVIVGDAEASAKDSDEARRALTAVLLADPLYRDAKRVLFKHQL